MKIVFMGTPDFAVVILEHLLRSDHEVLGVVTVEDKQSGRGRKVNQSAVKQFADKKGIPTLQPSKLKDEEFISQLQKWNADCFVIVAFRMLPEIVWTMPTRGTINLHGSLLPQYRGAAPINWAIMNGEPKTGVTTFFIEKEIDTGNIIERQELLISENMTAGELHDEMAELGGRTMVSTLNLIRNENTKSISQNELIKETLKDAPKIFKEDCGINWNKTATEVHNFIRGLAPYPGSYTSLLNNELQPVQFKLFASKVTDIPVMGKNIVYNKEEKSGFLFPCSDYYIAIGELQMQGKRRMTHKEFAAGNAIEEYSVSLPPSKQ